jgi:hypothetical protein
VSSNEDADEKAPAPGLRQRLTPDPGNLNRRRGNKPYHAVAQGRIDIAQPRMRARLQVVFSALAQAPTASASPPAGVFAEKSRCICAFEKYSGEFEGLAPRRLKGKACAFGAQLLMPPLRSLSSPGSVLDCRAGKAYFHPHDALF